jgi:hypothetical protein
VVIAIELSLQTLVLVSLSSPGGEGGEEAIFVRFLIQRLWEGGYPCNPFNPMHRRLGPSHPHYLVA